nr:SCP2 sterol-binding domain-containing protein [Myxococcota bacterium]
MADFPASPIAASEFMESWFPSAFAEADLPPGAEDVQVKLGVKLEGDGGGEWLFHIEGQNMQVEAGSRDGAAFTIVQSVADWRGALWEGRGGAIGKGAATMFRPGEAAAQGSGPGGAQMGGAPTATALGEMEKLDGVIRMVVAGGEGGDWAVDFKLGPGEIPAEPTTTVTVSAEDAAAMETGELDPMTAFMSGRMQVTGDMTLMMQMQAIQMQAAATAAA